MFMKMQIQLWNKVVANNAEGVIAKRKTSVLERWKADKSMVENQKLEIRNRCSDDV